MTIRLGRSALAVAILAIWGLGFAVGVWSERNVESTPIRAYQAPIDNPTPQCKDTFCKDELLVSKEWRKRWTLGIVQNSAASRWRRPTSGA